MSTLLLRTLLVAACLCLQSTAAWAYSTSDTLIAPETMSLRILDDAQYLPDSERKYAKQAILRGDLDQFFRPVEGRAGPANGAWFKFTLRSESSQPIRKLLSFETPIIREAVLYQTPVDDESEFIPDTGVSLGVKLFAISLDSYGVETYYLFLDAPLSDYNLVLEEPLLHVKKRISQTQASHLFYGASLGIFLYALILLATTRQQVYLWFSASIFSYTMAFVLRDGAALSLLPSYGPQLRELLPLIFFDLSSITFAMFFSVFLALKKHWPAANNVVYGFVGFWVAMLAIMFFLPADQSVRILTVSGLVFLTIQMGIMIPLSLEKHRDAIFFLGGYSPTLIIFTYLTLVITDVIPAGNRDQLDWIEFFGPQFGQFVWMIVLVYALGHRIREISDREVEATLESQSKSSFLATMSHEIRTPMNGVLGMTELLSKTPMTSQQENYVSTIYTSASTLLTILDDILDYSKMQSGKLELERIPIDLYQFTSDVALVFSAMSEEKGVPLIVRIDDQLPQQIYGDPTRIRQIAVNLLGNAFKFTSSGHIALNLVKVGEEFSIRVHDTGIGISTEDQQHIFATFSQADKSTNRKFGGSGLGLSISRDLTAAMGGNICVESEIGIGSKFVVNLPLEYSSTKLCADSLPVSLRRLRVLVYEPLEVKRRNLTQTLNGWRVFTFVASDANELDDILTRNPELDLVVTSAPQDLPPNHPLKVIHVTPVSSNTQQNLSADCMLEEPVAPNSLLTSIESIFIKAEPAKLEVINEESRPDRTANLKVLVAEDNEINQRVICAMLKKLGIKSTVAKDGNEAYTHFKDQLDQDNPFDVILMDCEMPEVDGYAATRLIREHESTLDHHVEIVALTANVLPEHRKRAMDEGMDEFLTKPVKLAELQKLFDSL